MNSRAVFNFKYLERDLSLSGKNKCSAKRLLETLNKENNKLDKPENRIKTVSIDVIKELVTETFKVQVETIRKNCLQLQYRYNRQTRMVDRKNPR